MLDITKHLRIPLLFWLLLAGVPLSVNAQTDCENDVVPPTPICLTGLSVEVDPEDGFVLWGLDFDAGSFDDCDGTGQDLDFRLILESESDGTPPTSTFLELPPELGNYAVEVWVGDNSGNWAFCTTLVTASGFSDNSNCDDDIIAPTAICEANLMVAPHPVEGVTIWAQDIDEGSWDECSGVIYRLQAGSEYDGTPPSTESVFFPPSAEDQAVVLWVSDAAGNWNTCFTEIEFRHFTSIIGQIYTDTDGNCQRDETDEPAPFTGWRVRATITATGDFLETTTQSDGSYVFALPQSWELLAPDEIEVQLILPTGFPAPGCPSSYTIDGPIEGGYAEVNFGLAPPEQCLLTAVDISTPLLRRCFVNTYHINYYNYSTEVAEDATIQVVLDPFMSFENSSLPATNLGNGIYEFNIGDLAGGEAGHLWLQVELSCEAEIGMTHCISASIRPYTCGTGSPSFTGADLRVEGDCDEENQQVSFRVTNIGNSPLVVPQSFRVVEDVVMYMQGEVPTLNPDESQEYFYPANGATWRMEVDQAADHPESTFAAAFVEGCGGLTTGMANLFSLGDSKPNFSLDCLENVGSWDPNDKQAFPRGYGEQHFIEANTDIEYKIRFQNTGTDTAFNIRIEDQLSPELNWQSISTGASSHPYRMTLNEDGLLQFYFDNIMLPDSNVNEPASHGFVQFRIKQQPDLADGTILENTAGIYFDFNEAVVTNTVTHTIGSEFVLVRTQSPTLPGVELTVSPNPMAAEAVFRLTNYELQNGQLHLYDSQGRPVRMESMDGGQFRLSRGSLASGLYLYQIYDENRLIISGKLLIQ